MEEHTEFQGWELLPRVDLLRPSSGSTTSDEDGGDSSKAFEVINSDFFILDSGSCGDKSGTHEEKGLPEPDDPKFVEPNSVSDQLTISESTDSVKETMICEDSLGKEMVLEGIVCSEESSYMSWLDSWGDEIEGVTGDLKQVEIKGEVNEELGLVSSPKASNQREDFSCDDVNLDDLADCGGEKSGVVWWKVPFELVKFYIFRVRPVWTVSIAAAMVGLVMLSRRLYKMRRASQRIPVAVGLDDKKALHIPTAARLNEAFIVLRRVPSIKASLPTTGVTPWPAMALR